MVLLQTNPQRAVSNRQDRHITVYFIVQANEGINFFHLLLVCFFYCSYTMYEFSNECVNVCVNELYSYFYISGPLLCVKKPIESIFRTLIQGTVSMVVDITQLLSIVNAPQINEQFT